MTTPDPNKPTAPDASQTVNESSESRRGRRPSSPSLKRALIVLGCGVVLTGAGAVPLAGEISTAIADSPSVKATIVDVRYETPGADGREEAAVGEGATENAKAPETAKAEEPAADDAPLECSPVAAFEVDGQGYNASSNDFSTDCDWSIGQEVKVAYDPENPVEARIVTEEFNPATTIAPGIGAAVFIGGLFMTLSGLRKRRS